jgi:hypothetical protein
MRSVSRTRSDQHGYNDLVIPYPSPIHWIDQASSKEPVRATETSCGPTLEMRRQPEALNILAISSSDHLYISLVYGFNVDTRLETHVNVRRSTGQR